MQKVRTEAAAFSSAQQQALITGTLVFSACMRAHGLPQFPDPQKTDGGVVISKLDDTSGSNLNPDSPAFQHAWKACQAICGAPASPPGFRRRRRSARSRGDGWLRPLANDHPSHRGLVADRDRRGPLVPPQRQLRVVDNAGCPSRSRWRTRDSPDTHPAERLATRLLSWLERADS